MMKYYFVSHDGDYIETEENIKGWFDRNNNPDMFTQRKLALAEAKRRVRARIKELQNILENMDDKYPKNSFKEDSTPETLSLFI